MKPYKQVEETRRSYHAEPALNSVHRSSLLVAELPGAVTEISFLNHFLLKRKYPKVALRLTGIDAAGQKIESRLHHVTEPRVHTFRLTGSFSRPIASTIVEFFAAENLFIPFPAVMINHSGPGFLNTVHAYNRALNDVFEDDAINATHTAEASIDVVPLPGLDTFLMFTAGPLGGAGELELELATEARTFKCRMPLKVPRFCSRRILLREAFPDLPAGATGVLKARQPAQSLFYGRMMVGHLDRNGCFTANHSYYDSSDVTEYWDDKRDACRSYPYLAGFDNRLRIYPIMSPGELEFSLTLRGAGGRLLGRAPVGVLKSPGSRYLDVSVGLLAAGAKVRPDDVESFALTASCGQGRMPTRVNHQMVYTSGGLESSINISLVNPNFVPMPDKKGLVWGQMPVGRGLSTILGFTHNSPEGPDDTVEVVFYGAEGELGRVTGPLAAAGALRLDSKDLDPSWDELSSESPSYLWYMARSDRRDLSAIAVSRDNSTGHCTGEHSF